MPKETRKYKDRARYNIEAVTRRRKQLKEMAIRLKGGRCQICGYNRHVGALEFHHLEEGSKEFGLSTRGLTRSWEKIRAEVEKCILVCANCHREIHGGLVVDLGEKSRIVNVTKAMV
ncbi:MAG: hypothetical protein ACOX50_05360 [Patescibacteria group bacterium]|jgi:hypothetical protein